MKIIDLHCDTLMKLSANYSFKENSGHISEQNLIKGGYAAQCFAVYTPPEIRGENAFKFANNEFIKFRKMIAESEIFNNKISAVLTMENAEFLNQKIERIKVLKEHNVKILGLVHNDENCLAYPHSADKSKDGLGLKNFGKTVVDYLNFTDITVDVSHLNYGGFCDVAKFSKKPFVATHSACREICNHSRNLYDTQIKQIANSGGVIGIPFYSKFLNGGEKTDIKDIILHLKHLIKIGGEDAAAIGTDFDGMECLMFIKDASGMQVLADALIKEFGFWVAEKICFKNALKVL